jgi:hypothetical protein
MRGCAQRWSRLQLGKGLLRCQIAFCRRFNQALKQFARSFLHRLNLAGRQLISLKQDALVSQNCRHIVIGFVRCHGCLPGGLEFRRGAVKAARPAPRGALATPRQDEATEEKCACAHRECLSHFHVFFMEGASSAAPSVCASKGSRDSAISPLQRDRRQSPC